MKLFSHIVLAAVAATFLWGCSSDNSVDGSPPMSNMEEEMEPAPDTTPPTIQVTGLSDVIEVSTTLQISIADDADTVSTIVMLNETEITRSSEKEFTIELDPFDFPAGEATLSVSAVDESENEGTESAVFELRRFMASIIGPSFVHNTDEGYVSVNAMDGTLLDFIKVQESSEIVRFYADDSVERQPIVLTAYHIPSADLSGSNSISSYGELEMGTDLAAFQQSNGIPASGNPIGNSNLNSSTTIVIDNIPDENIGLALAAQNVGYRSSNNTTPSTDFPGNFRTELRILHTEELNSFFIRTDSFFSNTAGEFILPNAQNYHYLLVNGAENQSLLYEDLQISQATTTVNLPQNIVSYGTTIYGVPSESTTNPDQRQILFRTISSLNQNSPLTSFEIPLFQGFNVVESSTFIILADGSYTITSNSIKENIEVPNWNATREGNNVMLSGGFEYYVFDVFKRSEDFSASLFWNFFGMRADTASIPFDSFEMPLEVRNLIETQGIDLSNLDASEDLGIVFLESTEGLTYKEILFPSFFPVSGDRNARRFRIDTAPPSTTARKKRDAINSTVNRYSLENPYWNYANRQQFLR